MKFRPIGYKPKNKKYNQCLDCVYYSETNASYALYERWCYFEQIPYRLLRVVACSHFEKRNEYDIETTPIKLELQ